MSIPATPHPTQIKMTSTTPTTKNYLVVLPVEGRPYIHSEEPKDEDARLAILKELVGGFVERSPQDYYTIHPAFCENPKWDIARQLLNIKSVGCYGNEEGMRECSPNMAVMIRPQHRIRGWPPHSFGNEVLVVPEKVLELLKVKVEDLKEQCVSCGEELTADYKEYDALNRVCKNGECDEE